ncbi:MAG: WGR domain-containing protein [Verrucomicrobiota bacterium]
MENITLYYRQGSSDKIYQASIEQKDDGYIVNFAYGRRGASLQTGTKNSIPVDYGTAKALYERLVQEKAAKGYTPGEAGTPYQHTGKEQQTTGIHCQLLNPAEEGSIPALIEDAGYWMQEKFDGRRLLIQRENGSIIGINRLGLAVALPGTLAANATCSPVDFLMDGEAIGDDLHVFDLLQIEGKDLRGLRYEERYLRLTNLLRTFQPSHVHLVATSFLPQHKREEFERLKLAGKEGVVFKRTDAHYVAGRPASGGSQHKFKFYETASLVVTRINAKRSVSLMLFEEGKNAPAGNVTVPPNQEIPKVGDIVECRYLYAFKESGSIYQPVYLGKREDLRAEDCTTAQLKYKTGLLEKTA